MKKNIAILMTALMSLMACQKEEEQAQPVQEEITTFTLTVKAEKEADTKGLNLDGTTLNTCWKSGEKVAVYKDGGYLGDLDVTPDAGNARMATLSGTVTGSLAANDRLVLLFPRKEWDYTGQTGELLQADGSIEKNYDYARADVTVTSVSGSKLVVEGSASFHNQQSIYRISFTANGSTSLPIKYMTLSSGKGKLVRSMVPGGETAYGDLTVNMATTSADLADGLICVAVRNDDPTAQDYHFSVADASGKAYIGSKHVPAEAFEHKFLGIKNLKVSPLTLSKSDTEVSAAL